MLTAEDLERVYAIYSSAFWRGDATGEVLENWFRVHWVEASPHQPESAPAAISPHGAGGRGILWYENPASILGFVPGRVGCYVIKRSETVPVVPPPKPPRDRRPARLQPVAHFQSGTWARHLPLQLTTSEASKD